MNDPYLAHYDHVTGSTQSVYDHLVCSARIAYNDGKRFRLPHVALLAAAYHDLGKYHDLFQERIRGSKERVDHSTAGARFCYHRGKNEYLAIALALVIAGHHTGLPNVVDVDTSYETAFYHRMFDTHRSADSWKQMGTIAQTYGVPDALKAITGCRERTIWRRARREMKAAVRYIRKYAHTGQVQIQLGFLVRLLLSIVVHADRTDTSEFFEPANRVCRETAGVLQWETMQQAVDHYIAKLQSDREINNIRNNVLSVCKRAARDKIGVYDLTVPTGGGKTLSSLSYGIEHAQENRSIEGIVYVAPYISIIDQNAATFRSVFNDDTGTVPLEHHSMVAEELQGRLSRLLSYTWDTRLVCTTMVQVLNTLFSQKPTYARHLRSLAHRVLIFDELQALPLPQMHLFANAALFLNKFCKSTIVACTATQPQFSRLAEHRGNFDTVSIIDNASYERYRAALKRVTFVAYKSLREQQTGEVVAKAEQLMKKYESVLVVVNTKKVAQFVYYQLRDSMSHKQGDDRIVYHLSAAMCAQHRTDILNEISERLTTGKPVVCVCTQVIEAGVDIDFAVGIRALTGIDSIIQTAGRVNRNNTRKNSKLYIIRLKTSTNAEIGESFGSLTSLKEAKQTGEKAIRIVHKAIRTGSADYVIDNLDTEVIDKYYECLYSNSKRKMQYPVKQRSHSKLLNSDTTILDLLGNNQTYVDMSRQAHPYVFTQSFETAGTIYRAIETSGVTAIASYNDEAAAYIDQLQHISTMHDGQAGEYRTLLRKCNRYSVTVHVAQQSPVLEQIGTTGIYTIDNESYNREVGFSSGTSAET